MNNTRNVDPGVAEARARLANTCRNNGTAEAIANAKDALAVAKAERLKRDAEQILLGMASQPDRLLVTGYGDDLGVPRELHAALFSGHKDETDRFIADNGPARLWDAATSDLWLRLIAGHRAAHRALGCSSTSSCTGAANRG